MQGQNGSNEKSCRKLPRCKVSQNSALFREECIFCQSIKMTKKNFNRKRLHEGLTKCLTAEAEKKIKSQAVQNNDFKMLGLISDQDLVAREAMYHKSCYISYLYNPQTRSNGRPILYEESWKSFKVYIQKKLVDEKKCLTLQHLLKEFKKLFFRLRALMQVAIHPVL